MPSTSTYLNFARETEAAFLFYRSVFKTEFGNGGRIMRFRDMPAMEGMPPLPEDALDLVLHVELPILGGHLLQGTDAPESMGFTVNHGNTMYISLHPDTRAEADRLFGALSEGGVVEQAMGDMFWGAYFGSFVDRFGVRWMINCTAGA